MKTHILKGPFRSTFCGLVGLGKHSTVYAVDSADIGNKTNLCARCVQAMVANDCRKLKKATPKMDITPRYVPETVMCHQAHRSVIGTVAYPPGQHPIGCPIVPDLTAVEVKTQAGSRWYGVQRAWINSRLRMVVCGFPRQFEEMSAWKKVPKKSV